MSTLALNIDIPSGVTYDAAKLKGMVTDYIYKLIADNNETAKKSNVSGFRKLRGSITSDISYEDMRREAIREKYGV